MLNLKLKKLISEATKDLRSEVLEDLLKARVNELKKFHLEKGLSEVIKDIQKKSEEDKDKYPVF